MAETISLRAYLGKVEDLLSVGQTDEVIHHCRHILQYYPRNVAAYLLLGRALLQKRRWDEGRAVFLRVLSARPDDFDAHVGLCEVYEQKGQNNDAIWHLERAFEQRPSDRATSDRLREMYKQHRNVNQSRMQLTTAAIARQQSSAGFHERALETLRTMLSRTPDRIDLRLLLAQTLWNNDQHTEAAETALDVLEKLPDCIEANAIMTRLWLSEERPSDALRFLNRLEATDPYLALELVQGQPAADEMFMLDELDYRRYAQREMATSRPDWLEGLDTTEFKGLLGESNTRAATASMTDRLKPAAPLTPPVEKDWPDLFGAIEESAPAATDSKKAPTTSDLFGDMPSEWSEEWVASAPVASQPKNGGSLFDFKDDPLAAAPPENNSGPFDFSEPAEADTPKKKTTGLLNFVDAPLEAPKPPKKNTGVFNFGDEPEETAKPLKKSGRLHDLNDAPDEVIEPPKTIDKPISRPAAAEDLPNWLQNTADTITPAEVTSGLRNVTPADDGTWLRDEANEPNFQQFIDDDESITIPPENIDPMAWLRSTGAEIDDEGERHRPSMYDDGGEGGIIADPAADPLSWMRDTGIELEEQMPDSLTGTGSGDLEWMNSKTLPDVDLEAAAIEARGNPDVDFFTWLEQQQQRNRVNADDVTIDDDPLEWLNDDTLLANLDPDDDIPSEVDARRPFDQPGGQAGARRPRIEDLMREGLIAQTRMRQTENFDTTGEHDTFAPTEQANEAERLKAMADKGDKQGPDWLNNGSSKDDLEWLSGSGQQDSDANAHLADWLNQDLNDDDEADAVPLADFDWVDAKDPAAEPEAEPESSVPSWLSELGPNYKQPEKTLYAADAVEDAPAEPAIESDEMPDWLSELGKNYAQPEILPTFTPADEPEPEPAYAETPAEVPLARAEWFDEDEDDPAQAQPATPDWITAINAQTAVSMATVTDEPEAADDAPVSADIPDWMSSLKPDTEDEPVSASSPDWMSNAVPDSEPDVPAPAGVPDWMAQIEPEVTAEDTPVSAEVPDWMAQIESEAEADAPVPVPADVPDWMAQLEPESSDVSTLEWLDSGTTAPEPVAETPAVKPPGTAEMLDWISELPTGAPDTSMDNTIDNETGEPLADVPATASIDSETLVAADIPDWMSGLQPDSADHNSSLQWLEGETPEPVAELPSAQSGASSFDWVNDLSGSDEPESELDDWMASTPSSLSDIAAAEQPPVTDFEWLNAVRHEDENQPVAQEPAMTLQGDDEPEIDYPEPLVAASEPATNGGIQWPSAEDTTGESTGQADFPDWLHELKPADEAPAVQSEQSFSWLDIGNADQEALPNTESDMPGWLSGVTPEANTAEPAASVEEIDWLSGIGNTSQAEADAERVEQEFDYAAATSHLFENMQNSTEQPEETTAESVEPQFDYSSPSLFDNMEEDALDTQVNTTTGAPVVTRMLDNDFELPISAESEPLESVVAEHAPAENAPDWLNAMVPGVDLDYAPGDDETLETVDATADQPSPTQEFDWLIDIVEEETQPASESEPVVEPEPVIAQTEAKPKFSFSKLPSWLRKGDDAATR